MQEKQPATLSVVDRFLPDILEREAKGYLADALAIPEVMIQSFSMNEAQVRAAVAYVCDVFMECYRSGHLKVLVSHDGDCLCGYALAFVLPGKPAYLHKIFVMQPYRGHGLGRKILETVVGHWPSVALLCPVEKVGFYEKMGFESFEHELCIGKDFELSRPLYSDLVFMANDSAGDQAPIFLLNDNDLRAVMECANH